ncbi:hypothetical protein NEOLEDRAFT_1156699 [Neolentinus lepideus HHB14362 ss-1]|uniref:Uncharacterized protein n=1 Tax=Neolentinus lepideus HHB14362 ss-1 TaxID=1314782 RepID=A0A165S6Q5_9AGAM|nr:hypothetical protein NEOLEDRAFT_1156699 [Neolentinus lepideus HHB14362 ss-1]
MKGPNVMSKSVHMQCHYKQAWKDQKSLDNFNFSMQKRELRYAISRARSPNEPEGLQSNMHVESPAASSTLPISPMILQWHSASVLSELCSTDNGLRGSDHGASGSDLGDSVSEHSGNIKINEVDNLEEAEDMEEELEELGTLWTQIKGKLQKKSKILPLSHINQLMILSNFATLCLKGYDRMSTSIQIACQWHKGTVTWFAHSIHTLARHYQEKRGGGQNAHSLLHNKRTRTVTPHKLQNALNTVIFPDLNIALKKPLSEQMARHWLMKLGWCHTHVKKGVYMDVFLPAMVHFEPWIVHFEGPKLCCVEPVLVPGECCIITQYQDESCCSVYDEAQSHWLGQQPLCRKGRGQLIHVDTDGNIIHNACQIIYPGSNRDPWGDHEQLFVQVKEAIDIFELAHPDCQALFVFNQSLVHASLPPDTLHAFEMNKSNGGKQHKQRDTVIPQSNPVAACCGHVQKMTTPLGEAKGLKDVLQECSFNVQKLRAKCLLVCPFKSQNCCMACLSPCSTLLIKKAGHEVIFLPKFHCKLNLIEMYWGWCKYHYWEVPKQGFAHAKELT